MATARALVVDDSRAMRLLLSDLLHGMGYQTLDAGDGEQAIEVLEREADALPEVALVDWNMPVMNGLEFIHAVRQQHRYAQLKLLVVTSEAEQGQMLEALNAGADEYLMKPFSSDALSSKLALLGLEAR